MKTKIQKIYREVYKSIERGDSLNKFKAVLSKTVQACYPEATQREKAVMYRSALQLRRDGDTRRSLEQVIKAENYIQKREQSRAKMTHLKEQVKESRDKPEPVIFYLCSHHANPAEDHKDWEGRIYIDRFWRSTVQGVYPESVMKQVESYVKDNDVRSVQWVTGEPVYMITRPYCRHFFIPVPTSEVLEGSVAELQKSHPESKMWYRKLDPRQKEARFQDKRKLVARAMGDAEIEGWTGYAHKRNKKIRVG